MPRLKRQTRNTFNITLEYQDGSLEETESTGEIPIEESLKFLTELVVDGTIKSYKVEFKEKIEWPMSLRNVLKQNARELKNSMPSGIPMLH